MDCRARRALPLGRVMLVPLTALFLLGAPLHSPAESSVARPVIRVVLRVTRQFLQARQRIELLRELRERLWARLRVPALNHMPPPHAHPDSARADFERFVHLPPPRRPVPRLLDHAAPAEET